jgi:8-oxo-dGTP pyrophosphatase MutT (NUDIX family)
MSAHHVYQKVYAFITRGTALLTFIETGTEWEQVPGGTLEDHEEPHIGVIREAEEETGLTGFEIVSFLERNQQTMHDWGNLDAPDCTYVRWFYHLRYDQPTPDTWTHWEMHASDGSGPHEFVFKWTDLRHQRPKIFPMRNSFQFRDAIEEIARRVTTADQSPRR